MNILLIGSGCGVPIPPPGWGGIAKVVWKYSEQLIMKGHNVVIYNERNPITFKKVLDNNNFDIVYAHDEWALCFLKSIKYPNFLFTSHCGSWESKISYINDLLLDVPNCLLFHQMAIYPGIKSGEHKYNIINGADNKIFYSGTKIKGKCVAVGNNEPRKKFQLIADLIKNRTNYEILFIGPNCQSLKQSRNIKVLGNSSEAKVAENMRDAEYFFHLSDAEADALVVREAAMSGCRLILSPYCAKCVGEDISWTDVEHFEKCPDELGIMASKKAMLEFTWEKVVDNFLEIIKDIKAK